ncbi:hypothetical protein [Serratia marcescens]|uniref:hypothetical protein n=1 Tax=Serratia marcescens TaxID=615 RepID=UPI001F152E3C|nr:hypothetical protein [Serratia marcescens]
METVNEIRGATWIAYLLDKGGYKSLAEMHEALDLVGSVQSWGQYKAGKASPQESTVKLADRAVPGSASLFLNGPLGLPVWAVLDGDMAVCQRVVSDLLNAYLEPEPWMSVARRSVVSMGDSERLKAVLEIVLPQAQWHSASSSVRYNPNEPHKLELVDWLSLSELLGKDENSLAVSYSNDKIKAGEKNIIKSFVLGMTDMLKSGIDVDQRAFTNKPESNLTNPAYVLAFIALIQICNESRDKNLMQAPEFIKLGIKDSVIDCFSIPIANFVKKL